MLTVSIECSIVEVSGDLSFIAKKFADKVISYRKKKARISYLKNRLHIWNNLLSRHHMKLGQNTIFITLMRLKEYLSYLAEFIECFIQFD